MKVRNIEVGDRIGEAAGFRIYLGNTDDGQPVILKIARTFDDNDILIKEAAKFNALRAFEKQVAKLEAERNKTASHYDWLFANLLSSFMEPAQGDRWINAFTLQEADFNKFIPVTKLFTRIEIDTRTSVWILGRLLKLYGFFELLAVDRDSPVVRYPIFSPDDYLIGPERHRLIYYNFSGDLADVTAKNFVKVITEFILDWMIVGDGPVEQEYFELLKDFSEHGRDSFGEAHRDFYESVDKLWGIQYYPFTYRNRDTLIWKTIKEV